MTTLVTGGTGYVGGAIARALRARGDSVRVLARPTSKTDHLTRDGVEVAIGDILNESSIVAALEGCDTLYHAAAIYQLWVPDPDALIRTEVDGTRNVMQAARSRGLRKVVYTSTTLSIGEAAGEVGNEDTPHRETCSTAYGEAKYRAELVVHEFARAGLPVVIVNPSGVYGPGGVGATSEALLKSLNRKMPMVLHGIVSLLYVDDVAAGHLLAAERGRVGERYILSDISIDAAEWIRRGCTLANVKAPFVGPLWTARIGAALSEPLSRVTGSPPLVSSDTVRMLAHGSRMDGSKAVRELGVRYTPVDIGLPQTLAWYWQAGLLTKKPPVLA